VDDKSNPGAAPLNDLSEPLRQAVDQVRAAPVPADALSRALEKAEKLGTSALPIARRPFRWPVYALATAAGMLVAVTVWQFLPQRPEQRAAQVEIDAALLPARERAAQDRQVESDDRQAPTLAAPQGGSALRVLDEAKEGKGADKEAMKVFRAGGASTGKAVTAAPPPPAGTAAPRPVRRMMRARRANVPAAGAESETVPALPSVPMPASGKFGDITPRDPLKAEALEDLGVTVISGSPKPEETRAILDTMGRAPSSASKDDRESAARKATTEEKQSKQKPRVWRRNNGKPSFARVYVGDGNALELVSLDVQVTIEGPRARTIVDHVFRNTNPRQLEGTFEYPLPSGASPSYFAMFLGQSRPAIPPLFARRGPAAAPLPMNALAGLPPEQLVRNVDRTDWGRLQEARIVGRDKALETYEEVVRGRIDPALLEYASGNTFRGRVFPIPPRGYNRVILAYEELLPTSSEKMIYRFPLPEQKIASLHFTLQTSEAECRVRDFSPKGGTTQEGAGHVYYNRNWADEEPKDPEVVFTCTPASPDVQTVSGLRGKNGPTYAYARVRPGLKKVAADKVAASNAVFLLDTSLSEHAARFDVSMKLLRAILERDSAIKQFNVIAFNAAATWVEPKGWLPNTKEGRESLFKQLDGLVLEGATDVGAALDCLALPPVGLAAKAAVDCFLLSDGQATWGEIEVAPMVARFESRCPFIPRFQCYLTGISAENAELFAALTRRGGGIFSCRGEAEIAAAAVAHRNQCLQVESVRFVGGPAASDILVAGRRAAVYPDGELVVAARFQGTGHTNLVVEGTFAGAHFVQEFPVDIKDGGELAPRAWAEIAVASLLALNDSKLDPLVTSYCQQFNIGSRVASFLVLENEADYKRLNLDQERGKTASGDLGAFLDRMWTSLAEAVSPRNTFLRFFDRIESRNGLLSGDARARVRKLVSAMADKDFELPEATLTGALLHKSAVPREYLTAREANRFDASLYIAEARRRANGGDLNGAIRVLSSIIEEHPSRGDALRLVGYRLLDLKQPAQAARLFERVERQRPFEPHSYRDLARSLEETGNVALAALQYEIILGSAWHNRFGESIKLVAQEEYCRLIQDAIRRKSVSRALADYFGERVEHLPDPHPNADLRATISWNTDATDVDLWVIEPDGTKCFYRNNRTKNGGELSQDQTQGYGPERYQVKQALKGKYRILVHYFNDNPNLLAGETHVNVVVTRFAGSAREITERHTVILRTRGEEAEVCEVEFSGSQAK
jgi:tetratricopeptide (TPR) repeat protein